MTRRFLTALSFFGLCSFLGCERSSTREPDVSNTAQAQTLIKSAPTTSSSAASKLSPNGASSCELGTNLGEFQDYSVEWPLVDAFKRSRKWISASESTWDDGRKIDVDADGWVKSLLPGQTARALLFWTDDSKRPSGDYTVTYDGDGALDFWITGKIVSSAPGRYVVRVGDGKNGLAVGVTRTNPKNPLRHIRVFLPGGVCEKNRTEACHAAVECGGGACVPLELASKDHVFHPEFLRGLAPYHVLRFMDWMFTNHTEDRAWDDRPKPTDVRFTDHGVPVETMVALTNELGADPWFTLPRLADDGYVKHFAEYVRDNSKSQHIYVEYANEVWNSQFPQAAYAESEGKRLGLDSNAFQAQLKFYSRRAVQIFRIFESVFGSTDRLVRVMGSQAANAAASETILGFEDAAKHTDALAIAPYFGGEYGTAEFSPKAASMALPAFMKELAGPAVERALNNVRDQAAMAKRFNVKLVAYEGGQHLVGIGALSDDNATNALFDAANRESSMKDVYAKYLAGWRSNGGGLFVHFSSFGQYSRWGRWGAVERVGEPREAAPKLSALMSYGESCKAR
jgi:hypothetical protein